MVYPAWACTGSVLTCVCGLIVSLPPAVAADLPPPSPAASAEGVEFFEKHVRPVFAEHCYSCHGPKKQNAGLRLDTTAGIRAGSDAGPIVVPGKPDASLLVRAVRRETDYPMPPKQPLPPAAVAAIAQWVSMGAPLPSDRQTESAQQPQKHWAFQPVVRPAVPAIEDARIRNDIDRFVLAKLRSHGLTLSPLADRRTLIRRAYIDLIGLPPTYQEIEAFVHDPDPNAWEKLIDRLLASPHFGERWGRYWLDLARYADTKGYVFTEDRNYPYAYTYRDYVIRSFNEDKPYDRFLIEQIAADQLDLGGDRRPLAALGFLTLGRRFLNNIHDIIDDRIDVLCRTTMGLTVGCARCHDHKYDPVSMADYYGLYGVFASSHEPKDLPLIEEVKRTPEVIAFENELARREKQYQEEIERRHMAHLQQLRRPEQLAKYLQAAWDARQSNAEQLRNLARDRDLTPYVVERWRQYVSNRHAADNSVVGPAWRLASMPQKDWPQWQSHIRNRTGPCAQLHPRLRAAWLAAPPRSPAELWAGVARTLAEPAPAAVAGCAVYAATLGWNAPGGPLDIPVQEFDKIQNRADREALARIKQQIDAFRASNPHAPPRAHVLFDNPQPTEPVIFLRGNPNNRGPKVPRQAPRIVAPNGSPFSKGSGRLELAQAIASPANPLTARVMANRVWLHLFGKGIVRTPSDFGTRCDPPTHPELLDWLADEFIRDGWSVKRLIKKIMLSATYQQSSQVTPELLQRDPDNLLLARYNRRRLDFEPLRDSMLLVSGRLDRTIYGRPVNILKPPYSMRRSIYGFMDRSDFATLYRAFDVASPDQHAPMRYETTVPQQALFLLNSPFVVQMAEAIAARPEIAQGSTAADKIAALYRVVLGRQPTPQEQQLCREFVEQAPTPADSKAGCSPWVQLAQILLISNEFAFVD